MANTLANLARMYTNTTGQGTLQLTHAVPSFLTFTQAGVANGATVSYALYEGPHREIGSGVYDATNLTLTRATVYSSTNGGSKINLAGSAEVFISPAKEDFDTFLTAAAADVLFLTQTEGDARYQPLDADLTALAGLTSAADKVPYFTGSGSASVADFTSVARTLVAQTTQANMRTTGLGLGTAATQNTGTSGTNVPLLDGANTWSATQVISSSAAGATPLQVIGTDAGATGPSVLIDHFSASPAAFDTVAQLTFSGRDAGGNQTNYAQFAGVILDTTDGSEDGRFVVRTMVAGTLAARLFVEQGAYMAGATGTDKGVGTFNATAVYDDNVLLTCPGVEFIKTGKVSTDTWDAFVPDHDIADEVVSGVKVKGKRVKRKHRVAHEMKALLDGGFDPRDPKQYFKRLLDDEALPGMPTKANWQHGSHSIGEINSKLWLAVELLTATVKTMHEDIETLKKKVGA